MSSAPFKIGQFQVLRQVGSGGMGAVYLGRDADLDRQVAIKVIRQEIHDQAILDRFFREARAAAALRHPNIITIYASGEHEHQPYIVMEFVDGESFADIIKQKRSLSLSQKLSYLEQVCAGLSVAHRAGIVHRDIKPANVMVDRDGVVRILDFGIARVEGSAMTQEGMLMGSLNYMSPEQMLGRTIDHRSDIFSVGSLGYELLTYKQAFKGGLTDGLLQRLPYEDPPPLQDAAPDVPYAVEEIVMRALQKAPENRYPDLSEMRTALVAVIQAPPPPLAALRASQDDGTIVLPRDPAPQAGEPVGPLTPPSQYMAMPPPGTIPPPSAFMTSPYAAAPQPPPGSSHAPPNGVGEGGPASPSWSIKTKPGPAGLPVKTTGEARAGTAIYKIPVATSRPATVRPAAPPVAPRSPSRRGWFLAGVAAVALIAGAAVAVAFLTGPEPTPLERERPGIEAAMERFRIAYRNRDLPAVATAFPTLPERLRRTMQRTFEGCLVYEVIFDGVQVQVGAGSETQAEVTLRSTHTCTPQSDGQQTTTTQDETFTLRKDGQAWVINGVTSLAGGRKHD
jgi:serine/threonine protein kinase